MVGFLFKSIDDLTLSCKITLLFFVSIKTRWVSLAHRWVSATNWWVAATDRWVEISTAF